MQKLFIPHRLAGLNELISAINRNRFIGNKLKQEQTQLVALYAKRLKKLKNPVYLEFVWHEPNSKRDPDNLAAGKKFCLDGLVVAGILPNDTQKWVLGFTDQWILSDTPGVLITIKEVTDD